MAPATLPAPPEETPATPPGGAVPVPAFAEAYERYFNFVWRNLRRLGVPQGHLDDATQEVFLVLHRRFAALEHGAGLKTWLFRVVMRVAADQRRALRRRSPHLRQEGTAVPAEAVAGDPAESPHERAAAREGLRLLHRLLEELGDEQRAVFVLAELEELSMPQIAEALGLNLNTAYARLRGARRDFDHAVARLVARDRWRLR